jgi:perosamine synthetase
MNAPMGDDGLRLGTEHGGPLSPGRSLPRTPLLDWSSFRLVDAPGISSLEDLTYVTRTTSGRAAIFQALLQLKLSPPSTVLVPTYHCPTMVAPVILAGLTPAFFGLLNDGRPNLASISDETASKAKAMLVSHYFGYTRSLAEVRRWCDHHGIALIEDCAHCLFGQAGDRQVGAWGDFSTASLSKFLPVPEGGLLASATRPIQELRLKSPTIKAQIKGCVDILELSTRHERLAGLHGALKCLFKIKNTRIGKAVVTQACAAPEDVTMMRECDMGRIALAPLWVTRLLSALLPRGRNIRRRQENFSCYSACFENLRGAKALFPIDAEQSSRIAPYVFPLWVDDAERVYGAMRALELPVFRWDRIWPGTPVIAGDIAPLWRKHVLQLLCHQDLNGSDIERICRAVLRLLASDTPTSMPATHINSSR